MHSSPSAGITTRVISDLDELVSIAGDLNHIVVECTANPFLLSELLGQFIRLRIREGWRPLLLSLSIDGVLVGVAPLMTRRRFGVRSTSFLLEERFSPDFVIRDQYRKECIQQIIEFAFREIHTNLLQLTLPAESPNRSILEAQCESTRMHFDTKANPQSFHRIVPIPPSWDAFCSLQGRDFRRNIKRMKRNLSRAGTWQIDHIVDLCKEPNAVKRIYAVEKSSWKESWRRRWKTRDEDLNAVIEGSIRMSGRETNFRAGVFFLELNGRTIAYALTLECGKSAYATKTSFAEEYRELSPGTLVINELMHSLCELGQVKEMDCLTNLPAWKRWHGTTAMRMGVTIHRSCVFIVIAWLWRVERASAYVYRTLLDILLSARS
jgi:hypothetical protein